VGTDYCNTSTILDRIINFTQFQDLRSHFGHYIFEGEGGEIVNRDLDLVARKSVKLASGTQIKNSNFRASIIPCDYSICNLFKSLFVEEPGNMDGNEVLAENGLMLYPNPACDYITIQLEAKEQKMESTITIFDMAGRKMFSYRSYENQFDIDLSGFELGTYVISVSQNGENYYRKFIKE
jgi:hypothetical protein